MLRVAFPPMGILSLAAGKFFQALGAEIVVVPPVSRHTLDLGVANSPETLCIPCKLLFGSYVEAAELGASDIIMLGGPGTCRLGYTVDYYTGQLAKLGFTVRSHPVDMYHIHRDLVYLIRTFGNNQPVQSMVETFRFLLALLNLAEEMDNLALKVRAREVQRGDTERAYNAAVSNFNALTNSLQVRIHQEAILESIRSVTQVNEKPVLRIGLVGDIYTILTPFINHNLEIELGRMSVEVQRWFHFPGRITLPLPFSLRQDRDAQAQRAGNRYLGRDVGGFARSAVGEAALMAQGEVDGLIHVAPFNCTPEIVAQGALIALQREQGIPVLNLTFDEQTGRAGVMTRLEAFVDMLWSSKRRKV